MTDAGIVIPKGVGLTGRIADLARPFSVYATSASAAVAPIIIVLRMDPTKFDLSSAAIFVGAIFTGLAALYGAKAWEQANIVKSNANVAQAQAAANTTP